MLWVLVRSASTWCFYRVPTIRFRGEIKKIFTWNHLLSRLMMHQQVVCVGILWPSQPDGVMSSTVSLPNHTFTGQAWSSKRLTSIVHHILLPETDNCPSWISGREKMTVENISWSNLHKRMLSTWQGSNPQLPDHQFFLSTGSKICSDVKDYL